MIATCAEDAGDPGMIESGERLGLTTKQSDRKIINKRTGSQNFERDAALRVELFCVIDDAHSAVTDDPADGEGAERRADKRRGAIRFERRDTLYGSGSLKKRTRPRINVDQ